MQKKLALLIAGVLAVGCARHQESGSNVVPQSACVGRRQAVVSNNWNEAIEVFTRIGAGPTRIYVGTVRAGRREQFLLPDGARFAFVQQMGETNPQPTMPPSSQNLIDIRYLCE